MCFQYTMSLNVLKADVHNKKQDWLQGWKKLHSPVPMSNGILWVETVAPSLDGALNLILFQLRFSQERWVNIITFQCITNTLALWQTSLRARLARVSSAFPNRPLDGPGTLMCEACCPSAVLSLGCVAHVTSLHLVHASLTVTHTQSCTAFLCEQNLFLSCRQRRNHTAIGLLIYGRKVKKLTI